ncbi:hypothetical protein AgCh_015644 [Apium graveolens]
MTRLRRTARKSVPGGPHRVEGFRLPEQVVVFLSEKALSQKLNIKNTEWQWRPAKEPTSACVLLHHYPDCRF